MPSQAHHHLWDYSATQGRLNQVRYMLPEMAADIASSGHNITATVYLQANVSTPPTTLISRGFL